MRVLYVERAYFPGCANVEHTKSVLDTLRKSYEVDTKSTLDDIVVDLLKRAVSEENPYGVLITHVPLNSASSGKHHALLDDEVEDTYSESLDLLKSIKLAFPKMPIIAYTGASVETEEQASACNRAFSEAETYRYVFMQKGSIDAVVFKTGNPEKDAFKLYYETEAALIPKEVIERHMREREEAALNVVPKVAPRIYRQGKFTCIDTALKMAQETALIPYAHIARMAKKHVGQVDIYHHGKSVDGKNMLGLIMTLACCEDRTITIKVEGNDEMAKKVATYIYAVVNTETLPDMRQFMF